MMEPKNEWQLVCDDVDAEDARRTFAMRIRGGQLYRFEANVPVSDESRMLSVSMCFVPDPPKSMPQTSSKGTAKVRRVKATSGK